MKHQDAALVCFSGGQDSTTCLFWAKKHFKRVEAVCFTYGQKHSLEIDIARKIAADADVPFQLLDVSLISQLAPNSLTDTSIEMYEDKPADSYPNTFVPGRNMVFLTFAAIMARSKGIFHLVTGVSEADFSGYPDCREHGKRHADCPLASGESSPGADFYGYPFVGRLSVQHF